MKSRWELYKDETRSLMKNLAEHWFYVEFVKDGEGNICRDPKMFIDNLMSCEEGHLRIEHPSTRTSTWMFLVYGNRPGELVCDYGVSENVESTKALDAVTDEHWKRWRNVCYEMVKENMENPYDTTVIRNIHRGDPTKGRGNILYAELYSKNGGLDGELLIAATLDYIVEALKGRMTKKG